MQSSRRVFQRAFGPVPGLGKRTANPFFPSPSPIIVQIQKKRYSVGETGDNKSGHITTTQQQGILFFNNILPPNLQWLFRYTADLEKKHLSPTSSKDQLKYATNLSGVVHPEVIFERAVTKANITGPSVVEVLPRLKEGGAFVKFTYGAETDPASVAAAIKDHLKSNPTRSWWSPFASVKARLVQGRPWVEDLSRLPSRRLRVEFLPTEPGAEMAELSQEQLYSFFRPFGKLADIITQPSDSKVLPRFAYLDFSRMNRAIMARNCLHGYVVSDAEGGGKTGTVLRLTYERKQRTGWIKDWIFSHPRIVLPIVAALVAGITVAIFDPLRTWSIRAHITQAYNVENSVIFRWFRRQGEDLINRVRQFRNEGEDDESGMEVVWEGRKEQIEQIRSWMMESGGTFIVVQGPRGSGKREFVVDHALRHKRDAHRVLVVDCKPVQEARGDAATIASAAAQVGYRPVFSWMNNISGLLDLASQGLTGTKAGFSETLENQLVQIWNKTSTALKSIALEGRSKQDKDAKLTDDEFLEAHPERRPVVVIDNFLHKSAEPGAALVYDKLADWAAQLITTNVAHVILLTHDVSFSKSLSKALPDHVFRQISLGDCTPEVAKQYVVNHLDFGADAAKITRDDETLGDDERNLTPSQKRRDLRELDSVIGQLGGRLTELEFLARRIKAGETPTRAVREIVDQASSEIMKMHLLQIPGSSGSSDDRNWTAAQAWTLVRQLASTDLLRYNEVLLSDAFKTSGAPSGETALAALEQAELITVQSQNGRPYSVRPGKPVYLKAFQQLVDDRVLAAKMDLAMAGEAIAAENRSIDKYEQELRLLGGLPTQPSQLRDRVGWLLGKIAASQTKLESLEKQSAELKKVLQTEF